MTTSPLTPDGLPPEVADHTVIHLSDTHLTSAGVAYNGVVDPQAALLRASAEIRRGLANGHRIDAIVASGDLTDSGDPEAYRRLRRELESLGPPVIWCTGNHDLRVEFQRSLLDRAQDLGRQELQSHRVGGLRVVVLDSTVIGGGHGRLDPDLLAALRVELSTTAPDGTVLVLHHAPLPPPSPLLTYFALERASRQALSEAVAGTDVRLILAGHHHLAQSGLLGSVPVVVAGSTAIRTDPLGPWGFERTTRSASLNLVRLYGSGAEGTYTCSVIPLDGAEQVFELDETGCRNIISAHPIN